MGIAEKATGKVVLEKRTREGATLRAIFLPRKGMNCISLSRDGIEALDQSTFALFEERYAGLGALIGPHFHHRHPEIIPAIADETLFPHIARVRAKGVREPFSHGIARYAPWEYEAGSSSIQAVISGKDQWNGIPLAELEGQNFEMAFQAKITEEGLLIDLSVVSETDSLVGLHYYYSLPEGGGIIRSAIQDRMFREGNRVPVSPELLSQPHQLEWEVSEAADWTFRPFPDPTKARISLETAKYTLQVSYESPSEENCWQLFHPEGASYVCIEPISSQDPRHPNLTSSSIRALIAIQPKEGEE